MGLGPAVMGDLPAPVDETGRTAEEKAAEREQTDT
jgi:hypothetical protein